MNETDLLTITSRDEPSTRTLAAALAKGCELGDCVLLSGDLGVGKTTFARGFIEALCGAQEVVSPTFNLVQTYETKGKPTIWHFDLYRLKKPQDAIELGLEEAFATGIALIEWPQLIAGLIPANALHIGLAYGPDGQRTITLQGGATWPSRLAACKLVTEAMQ